MDATVALTNEQLEMKAQVPTGWMCPVCKSVHAPFISTCSHCDAAKHPKVQAWLLNSLKERLSQREHTNFILKRGELEKLVDAVQGWKQS